MSIILLTSIISISIILILFFLSKRFEILVESPSQNVRKIHQKRMIKVGGLTFLSIYILFFFDTNNEIMLLLFFSSFFGLIGLISDLNENFTAKTRLGIFFSLVILYLILSQNIINKIDGNFIIIFDSFKFLFFFTCLSMVLFINGVNLIDGLHGLKTGVIIIITIILILNIPENESSILSILYCILISCLIFFSINFFTGSIRSGDIGSYFLGFIIATICIILNNKNIINSLNIACILSYPIIEVIFSYFRRIINGKSPFQPDNKHLHSLLLKRLLLNKYLKKRKEAANRIATLLILTAIAVINFFIYNWSIETIDYFFSFFYILLIYISSYLFLSFEKLKKSFLAK